MNEVQIKRHFNRKAARVFVGGFDESNVIVSDRYVLFLLPRDSKVFAKRDEYPKLPDVGTAMSRDGSWEWKEIDDDNFMRSMWSPLDDDEYKITDTRMMYETSTMDQRLFIGPDGKYLTAMQQMYYDMLGEPRNLHFYQLDNATGPIWVNRDPIGYEEKPTMAVIMPVLIGEGGPCESIKELFAALDDTVVKVDTREAVAA